MAKESTNYLDIYLDSITTPKKRGSYFFKEHEEAIVKFNSPDTSDRDKLYLFDELIEPSFRRIINGVLEMPQFHYLILNREDLIDNTFFRMVEKMNRFQPGRIGKNGQPVKAFSYFSTVAKNHILEQIFRNDKILKHKADVETSIDLSILSEETLEKMSNYDKQDVSFDSYESVFEETSQKVIAQIDLVIKAEESKDKPDIDLLKIGYCLKYLLKKWDKIEFMKKNEFMRILALYVGLKQQQVSFLFKKFKVPILENLNPTLINKSKTRIKKKSKKDIKSEEEITTDLNGKPSKMRYKHEVRTMEDFEIESERTENQKVKTKWMNSNNPDSQEVNKN